MSIFFSFKVGLLVFWWLWYWIALFTNLCEGFQALRVLPRTWPFASGNLRAVTKAINTYSDSRWIPRLLFTGILCFQFLTVLLFGWATISSVWDMSLNSRAINAAFGGGLGLVIGFMLADEILKQYDTEHSHVLFFIAQLISLLALYILPA
jgi:hypothetical protein